MGHGSEECKQAKQTYFKLKARSCHSCKYFKQGTCSKITNYDVVKKKEIPKRLEFYYSICGGYFYELGKKYHFFRA